MAYKKSFVRTCVNNISFAMRVFYFLLLVMSIFSMLVGDIEEYNIYYVTLATVFVSVQYCTEEPFIGFLEKVFAFLYLIPSAIFISIPKRICNYFVAIITGKQTIYSTNKINRKDKFLIYLPLNRLRIKNITHIFVGLVLVSVFGFLLVLIIDQFKSFPVFSEEYFYYRPIILILLSLTILFLKYIVRAVYFTIVTSHDLILSWMKSLDRLLFFFGKTLDLTLRLFVKIIQDTILFAVNKFSRKNKDIFESHTTRSSLIVSENQNNSSYYYQKTINSLKEYPAINISAWIKILVWIMSHTEEEIFVYLFDEIARIIKKHKHEDRNKVKNPDKQEASSELCALIIKSITLEFLLDLTERYLDEFKSYISRVGK